MKAEGAIEKGDALMREYIDNLIGYIEYYLQFEVVQADMVNDVMLDKYDMLWNLYHLAAYAGRTEIVAELNAYFRTLGASDAELYDVGDRTPVDSIRPAPRP